jgi:hypothetical protein
MPRRREQLGREGWEGDPLVPIHPEYLRAAIAANDWSVQKLAAETGNESQTLDHLAKGSAPKRCRQSRRAALAKALKVPETWLEGASVAVPELSRLPRAVALRLSPRLQLAAGDLFRKAAKALHRDLSTPEAAADLRRHAMGEALLRDRLFWFLFELIRPDHWRRQLTTWRPIEDPESLFRPEAPGLLQDFADLRTEAEDRAGLGLVAALEFALDPWFTGEAQLDYDRLRVLVGYDRASPPPGPQHPRYAGTAASPVRMIPLIALGTGE